MAAELFVASIALMTAFCAWTLAVLVGMVRDEIAKRNDDTLENVIEGE